MVIAGLPSSQPIAVGVAGAFQAGVVVAQPIAGALAQQPVAAIIVPGPQGPEAMPIAGVNASPRTAHR